MRSNDGSHSEPTLHGADRPDSSNPWAATSDEVIAVLGTNLERGLTAAEARRRLHEYGPNRLRETARRSSWHILRDQFASFIVGLLAAAALAAFAFGDVVEGSAVLVVIGINAAIGFLTERRAVRSMEALRELGRTETRVRRDGSPVTVPSTTLVPGDLALLDAGDVLSADVRIVSSSRLQVDESALTGESLAVDKSSEPVSPDRALSERSSMLFKGTAITRGSCEGVVVSTGMATELGMISALVAGAEPGTTPLERKLERLAHRLIGITLAIAALTAVTMALSGRGLYLAVETSIALAVAAIPEGLPIVATLALARGMWRMARRNALVEQLAAVETLGSTTVLLTDKTGTLTENRMTVVELRLDRGTFTVEGTGLDLGGEFRDEGGVIEPARIPELLEAIKVGVLCNDASLEQTHDERPNVTGDPMEVALLVAGAKAGLARADLLSADPELGVLAFDPEFQRMATIHGVEGAAWAAVKGAPESILAAASTVLGADASRPLDETERTAWLTYAEEMAGRGERVLALATGACSTPNEFDFQALTLIGLIGFLDPPRESARGAILALREAGIRVVMVTGDHAGTAWTIASGVGLVEKSTPPDVGIDGRSLPPLAELPESEIEKLLASPVVARATPRQKLDLIELHQRRGAVVAMTGDGVNDAPALKKADIGIAMGERGTQVAREAAVMVLQDDELGTLVTAVEQGRAIFANIRKFVVYLMSCNVSEIFVVTLGALIPGPLPILPLQILFLNLVTDVFPALALGVCRGSPALMSEPPRDPAEPVLTRSHWRTIFGFGGVIAVSVMGALGLAVGWLDKAAAEATSVAFLTLALAQMWHVFTMRNRGSGVFRNEITANPWVWGALALCSALLVLATLWTPLATVLSVANPGLDGWILSLGASLVPLAVGQLYLLRPRASGDSGSGA